MTQPRLHLSGRSVGACEGICAGVLSGSMVGPDYERPDAKFNEAWLSPTGDPPEARADDTPWREQFNDPTLMTSLIHEAYEQNLTLRIAGLRVLEPCVTRPRPPLPG